jgi:hypothetical protein
LPPQLRRDFQDLSSWRQGVVEVLDLALRERDATVIAPMTLVEPRYFEEIIGGLRAQGHDVRHFALLAERATVVRRLRERGFGHAVALVAGRNASLRGERFALAKLDRCLEQLVRPEFAAHVWTDDLSVAEVADQIATSADLSLTPNDDGPVRRNVRRALIGARHIRLG